MADALSVSSISLASAARLSSLLLPLPTTSGQAPGSLTIDSASSRVVLSEGSQVLSAVSSSRAQLSEALAATASTTDPASITALALALVDGFNSLPNGADPQVGGLGAGSDDLLVGTLLQRLGEQLAAAFAADTAQLASLESIGIGLTPNAASGGPALQIDGGVLAAALAGDAGASRAVLSQAAQSLLDLSATFAAEVVTASASFSGIPDQLLQNLPGDVLANNIRLTELTLGQDSDATAVALDNGLLQGSPGRDLLSAATVSSTDVATNRDLPRSGDVEAAQLRESTARLALQNRLSDPALTVLRNLLDPYYAGLVATARLSELAPSLPIFDPKSLISEFPAPVSPVRADRAIDSYREAAVTV